MGKIYIIFVFLGSVAHLLASPKANGLFHGAIGHSGATLNPWHATPIADAESVAFELGEKLGCSVVDSDVLLDCLLEKSVHDILIGQQSLAKFYIDPMVAFLPVVDSNPDDSVFLHEIPEHLIEAGKFNKVPVILTLCENEGLLLHAAGIIKSDKHIQALDEDWATNSGIQILLDQDLRLRTLNSEEKHKIMTDVRKHYFGSEKLKAHDSWTMEKLSEFYTDRTFTHGIRETAIVLSKHIPVYIGIFTRPGDESVTRIFGYDKVLGVSHVDDLQFFFNEFGFGSFPLSSELTEYSKTLVELWTNFAKFGVPSTKIEDAAFVWNQVTPEERNSNKLNWLDLGNIPNILKNPYEHRLSIWDQIYKSYGARQVREEL